ncbi:AAA family ATPase [Streptomyces sp. NPDC059917]|uniref:helix-turn-helix transcriptional regulator n=1 Tax=Streptomyces sp. NPDC059917 TaxID=3347002 RepID=UPI00364C956B
MALWYRDEERARLERALYECMAAMAGIVLIEGAVGCGKTELLQYVADSAPLLDITVVYATAHPDARHRRHALLRRLAAALPAPPEAEAEEGSTAAHFEDALRAVCVRGPVVLCVDDLQHADDASIADLLHTARALRGTGLLMVLAGSPHNRTDNPVAATELLRHPGFARIPLAHLDQRATAGLARRWGAPAHHTHGDGLHRITGGNPLLLRALLSELSPHATEADPEAGGPFTEALRTCLRRCDADTRRIARAVAVLGEHATLEHAAPLAGLTAAATARAMAALDAAGITTRGRLRHPAAETAVLDALDPARRRRLHHEAARVLHAARAEPHVVAKQLLAAGATGGAAWEIRTLCEAARQESAPEGSAERAAAFLQLARAGAPDERTRHHLALELAHHTWRLHPAAAHDHLQEPLAALRQRRLPAADIGQLARLLAAQGRVEEAGEALARLASSGRHPAPEDPLRELFALPPTSGPERRGTPAGPAAALWTHPGADDDAATAERLLRGTPLAQSTFEPLGQALRTLVHTDRPRRAAVWCRALGEEARVQRAPGWQAALATVHAEALLRLGDLTGAEREATAALTHLSGRGGLYLFAPLAVLVQALTAKGDHAAAAQHLQATAPGELYSTVHALNYLRARGCHYLATHRPQAALGEFLDAGRLAVRWGLDRPRSLPWRTDAAEAHLHLGQRTRAARLVAEQLAMPDAVGARVRGISLRASAATAEARHRPDLLTRAVQDLRDCGDRLELARALADLGSALCMSGEGPKAGALTRRARDLAAECGAVPLSERIVPGRTDEGVATVPPPRRAEAQAEAEADADAERLNESEKRVAALAAHGYTNREISAKLFVSVSTVEQYLTRAYRKLNISRRQDLPVDLRIEAAEYAVP